MIRNITADLYQIGECVPGETGHEAVRVYVMLNAGRPILIDCGSHLHHATLMEELERLLNDTNPEYIFLTHSELPHTGNLQAIVKKWPQIKVIVSNVMLPYIEILPVLPLDQIAVVNPGTTQKFAGRKLTFLSAFLKDQPGTHWIYDADTGTLFTGDGFGYYHPDGECELFSSEVPGGIPEEGFRAFHQNAFRFLRWVVPEKLYRDLDRLFERYEIKIIAPIHGNAIFDIPTHLARVKTALWHIYQDYRQE